MKILNFKTKTTFVLAFLFIVNICASYGQADLITDTRQGSYEKSTATPNRIFQKVEATEQSKSFKLYSPMQVAPKQEALRSAKSNIVSDAVYLKTDEALMSQLVNDRPKQLRFSIPVTAENAIELVLTEQKVLSNKFIESALKGEIDYDPYKVLHYKGYVKGNPNSWVAISISNNNVTALIADDGGNYNLGKIANDPSTLVLYNEKKSTINPQVHCGGDHLTSKEIKIEDEVIEKSTGNECIRIDITADHGVFTMNGSNMQNAMDYVVNLFNQTVTFYENEDISIIASNIFIYSTVDPYAALGSTGAVLDKFGDNTQNNINGDLAYFMYTEYLDWGGLAWINSLCESYNSSTSRGPYATSQVLNSVDVFPTYSWTVKTLTHEIGHSLGSTHTQNCVWGPGSNEALDNCYNVHPLGGCSAGPAPVGGGTMMSYCDVGTYCPSLGGFCNATGYPNSPGNSSNDLYGINFINGLGDFPGKINTPRSAIATAISNASCLTSCDGDEEEEEESSCFDSTIVYEIDCESTYNPVCGCDNQTYYNICAAFYLNGIPSYVAGACTGAPDPGTTCPIINKSGLEQGWGIWNDGGGYCALQTSAALANTGTKSAYIRRWGNFRSDILDFSDYEEVTIDFALRARNMDNAWDDIWIQISQDGGSTWSTIEIKRYGQDFQNNVYTDLSVTATGPFTNQVRLRFRSSTNANNEAFNIDDIVITGCENSGTTSNNTVIDYLTYQVNAPCYNPSHANITIDCSSYPMDLVCGCDGQTYYNSCYAYYSGLDNYYAGPCNNGSPTVDGLELPELHANEFAIYPNPATNQLNLQLDNYIDDEIQIEVYNMVGQQVFSFYDEKNPANVFHIDLSKFQNGLYSVTVKSANRPRKTKQFVVSKTY